LEARGRCDRGFFGDIGRGKSCWAESGTFRKIEEKEDIFSEISRHENSPQKAI
jgi:hypothetical protein